ncbi:MAG: HigA family addiction module antitoxin [Pseudomonadota bacterium]
MVNSETGLGFAPPHPGEILKEDVLPELGMTQEQFAAHLGVKRAGVSDLLNGKKPVTQEMAIRLGKALKTGARYWLAMQMQYDLHHKVPTLADSIDVKPIAGFDTPSVA